MILQREKERLATYMPTSYGSTDKLIQSERRFFKESENGVLLQQDESALSFDAIIRQSDEMDSRWKNYYIENGSYSVIGDGSVSFKDRDKTVTLDMTSHAFSQLCQRLGIPSQYIYKCFQSGKQSLALQNLQTWIEQDNGDIMFRTSDGIARAIVSQNYMPFDNYKILRVLKETMDKNRFVPTQVFLNQDRLHIRFVDFTPLPIDDGTGSNLYSGFVLSSSNVGDGKLRMSFFIFRPACTNGLIFTKFGGTLFSMNHIGRNAQHDKLRLFSQAFDNIDFLCEQSVELIKQSNAKPLSENEMKLLLQTIRTDLKLSQEKIDKLNNIININYTNTRWGFINGVTELAQSYDNLDTRMDMESWAGKFLAKSA